MKPEDQTKIDEYSIDTLLHDLPFGIWFLMVAAFLLFSVYSVFRAAIGAL